MDELITILNEKMLKRFNLVLEGSITESYKKDEYNISKELNPAKVRPQECVDDLFRRSNIMLVSIRDAHKRSKDNNTINRGHVHRRTYTKITTQASG